MKISSLRFIISGLLLLAIIVFLTAYYAKIQATSERFVVEQSIKTLQHAFKWQMRLDKLQGRSPKRWLHQDPRQLLSQTPLTIHAKKQANRAWFTGYWYFDKKTNTLAYHVRSNTYFKALTGPPAQILLRIVNKQGTLALIKSDYQWCKVYGLYACQKW